jgi:hypothetical protein
MYDPMDSVSPWGNCADPERLLGAQRCRHDEVALAFAIAIVSNDDYLPIGEGFQKAKSNGWSRSLNCWGNRREARSATRSRG